MTLTQKVQSRILKKWLSLVKKDIENILKTKKEEINVRNKRANVEKQKGKK